MDIKILDVNDHAPVFNNLAYETTIHESTPQGIYSNNFPIYKRSFIPTDPAFLILFLVVFYPQVKIWLQCWQPTMIKMAKQIHCWLLESCLWLQAPLMLNSSFNKMMEKQLPKYLSRAVLIMRYANCILIKFIIIFHYYKINNITSCTHVHLNYIIFIIWNTMKCNSAPTSSHHVFFHLFFLCFKCCIICILHL